MGLIGPLAINLLYYYKYIYKHNLEKTSEPENAPPQ